MKKLTLVSICMLISITYIIANRGLEFTPDTIPPVTEVEGVLQSEGFRLPPGSKDGLVLTSDSMGNGQWKSVIEIEPELIDIGYSDVGSNPRRLAVQDVYACVIDNVSDDLQVFDISSGTPQFMNSTTIGPIPADIAVHNDMVAIIESGFDSLYFFDLSNPASPIRRSAIKIPDSNPTACDVNGTISGVLGSITNRLYLFDFTNPDSVFQRGSTAIGGSPKDIHILNEYAFICDAGSIDLKIVDITDPDNPQVVSSILVGQNPLRLAVDRNIAYIIDVSSDELFSVDVSDVNNPVILDTMLINGFLTSMDIKNSFLFISDVAFNVIQVIDISNPAELTHVESFSVYPNIQDLAVSGNNLCVIDNQLDRITVIELSSGIPSIDIGGKVSQFDQMFDGLVEVRSPNLNDHLRLSRLGVGNVDLSLKHDKCLSVSGGSFFASGLGANDTDKGFFWGELVGDARPVCGIVYDGTLFGGDNKLKLKEMLGGDTSTLVTFKLDGKVGIGTTDPGGIAGLTDAKLQIDSGHVVVSNGYGLLSVNSTSDGIGAGMNTDPDDALSLYAGGSQRLLINELGKVGIGTTNPGSIAGLTGAKLQIENGHVVVSNNYGFLSVNSTSDGLGAGVDTEPDDGLTLFAGGAQRLTIAANGNVGVGYSSPAVKFQVGFSGDGSTAEANAWNTFSDLRYKKDLSKLDDPLDRLLLLNGYYYYLKNGPDTARKIGVVAQEVEEVFPELVNTNDQGYKSVDYGRLSAVLIEVVRQHDEKMDDLEQRNQLMHREIENLKKVVYGQVESSGFPE